MLCVSPSTDITCSTETVVPTSLVREFTNTAVTGQSTLSRESEGTPLSFTLRSLERHWETAEARYSTVCNVLWERKQLEYRASEVREREGGWEGEREGEREEERKGRRGRGRGK